MDKILESLSKLIEVPTNELEKILETLDINYGDLVETLVREASIFNALNPIRIVFSVLTIVMFLVLLYVIITNIVAYDFITEKLKGYKIYFLMIVIIAIVLNIAIPILAPHYTLLLNLLNK